MRTIDELQEIAGAIRAAVQYHQPKEELAEELAVITRAVYNLIDYIQENENASN